MDEVFGNVASWGCCDHMGGDKAVRCDIVQLCLRSTLHNLQILCECICEVRRRQVLGWLDKILAFGVGLHLREVCWQGVNVRMDG